MGRKEAGLDACPGSEIFPGVWVGGRDKENIPEKATVHATSLGKGPELWEGSLRGHWKGQPISKFTQDCGSTIKDVKIENNSPLFAEKKAEATNAKEPRLHRAA